MTDAPASRPDETPTLPVFTRARNAVADAVRFFTRIPVPAGWTAPARAQDGMAAASPIAGALVGLFAGIALTVALAAGLPPLPAAVAAAIAATLASGALHLDGLADVADSFGGATREKRLEIMRDSRLGTYGGAALSLAMMARAALVAALIGRLGALDATLALVAAAAVSRPLAFLPALLLDPARADGVGHGARPRAVPALFGLALGAAAMLALGGLVMGVAGVALAAAAAAAIAGMARRRLGGYTGDVCGAAAECAELAALAGLLAAAS